MQEIESERDLFVEYLQDIYSAEVLQIPALHLFEETTETEQIKNMIHKHTGETRMHVLRLEDLIDELDESLNENHCRTMKSMVEEAEALVLKCKNQPLKNLALLSSLQRIKQCETTVYRMIIELAQKLNSGQKTETLSKNLQEDIAFLKFIIQSDFIRTTAI